MRVSQIEPLKHKEPIYKLPIFDAEEETTHYILDPPPMEMYYGAQKPSAPLLPPKAVQYFHKKTLVLDLDETLVHSSFQDQGSNSIFLPVLQ